MVSDVAIANSEQRTARHLGHPRRRLAGAEHRAAAHLRRQPAHREHEGLRAARSATRCAPSPARIARSCSGTWPTATCTSWSPPATMPRRARGSKTSSIGRSRPSAVRFPRNTASGWKSAPIYRCRRTPAEISTMRLLKQALDPKGILNPGKGVRMKQPAHLNSQRARGHRRGHAVRLRLGHRRATSPPPSGWCARPRGRARRSSSSRNCSRRRISASSRIRATCALATSVADNRAIQHFAPIARELGVVLPISFFERANNSFFNSIAILDADGSNLGVYRKAHIPNGPGYQEKNYFSPGDTGFKVWDTRYARIGVAICWDQWFPEMRARDGAQGRGAAVLSDRHRQRAAAGAAGEFARSLAAHAAGPRRREPDAGRSSPIASAPSARCRIPTSSTSVSTAPASSPTPPAPRWPRRTRNTRP